MNLTLWIVAVLLALLFGVTGTMKLTQSLRSLEEKMGWVGEVPGYAVRIAGVAELLGAIGLILPQAFGVVPVLTPVAAMGLGLVMLLAIPVHARRDELGNIGLNLLLLALSGSVAAGRLMS
jgi:uncharacterized membrane protein YphA (DoxX/SURF4 family)